MAQEFKDGEHKDELFAGTPPFYIVRLILSTFASGGNHHLFKLMTLAVKCAFLYGSVKIYIYIEL